MPWISNHKHKISDKLTKSSRSSSVFPKSRQHVCFVRRRIQMSDVGFVKIISIWCLSVQFGRRSMKSIREDCLLQSCRPRTDGPVGISNTDNDVTCMLQHPISSAVLLFKTSFRIIPKPTSDFYINERESTCHQWAENYCSWHIWEICFIKNSKFMIGLGAFSGP